MMSTVMIAAPATAPTIPPMSACARFNQRNITTALNSWDTYTLRWQ